MSILLFVNLKGGVAKTTNAVAVAEGLADSGYRTLLIDADHQCMSGELLLGEDRLLNCDGSGRPSTTCWRRCSTTSSSPTRSRITSCRGLGHRRRARTAVGAPVLDPHRRLLDEHGEGQAGLPVQRRVLAIFRRRRELLRRWLRSNYDFTIIDCPPSIALQVKVFLTVATPSSSRAIPDRLSVRGSSGCWTASEARGQDRRAGHALVALPGAEPAAPRRWNRAEANGSLLQRLPRPFETIIPNAAAIAEATEPGPQAEDVHGEVHVAIRQAVRVLCEEIVTRSQWHEPPQPKDEKLVLAG